MSRPDIETALDVRSYERVIVIAKSPSKRYGASWAMPDSFSGMLAAVSFETVVVIDGADVTRRAYVGICRKAPRLLAVVVRDEEHARSVRRLLLSIQPWCDLYSISTDLGRLVVAAGFHGEAYDRDRVIDGRSRAEA